MESISINIRQIENGYVAQVSTYKSADSAFEPDYNYAPPKEFYAETKAAAVAAAFAVVGDA